MQILPVFSRRFGDARANRWTSNLRRSVTCLLRPVFGSISCVTRILRQWVIEHGLTLFSISGDFARFPGLRWQNSLAA